MKERNYNYFRVRDCVLGVAFVLMGLFELYAVLNKSNHSIWMILFGTAVVTFGIARMINMVRYKAYATIGLEGIRVCTKDAVLATMTWDNVVSCQYCNPWGGEAKGPKYTVLFTRNATNLDPESFDLDKELVDRHMYALYKRRMTPQEFDALEVIVLWAFGGREETNEIEQLINSFKSR